jgi:hypothetical protein
MNKILENMYSLDNSVYIILRKHEDTYLILNKNSSSIPEIINYYNILRYVETDKIDLIPKEKWDFVKKEIRYYENTLNKELMKYDIHIDKHTPVSRAWIKFYEILSKTKIYDNYEKDDIKAFHICEAPGTFIKATIHYLNNKKIYDWNSMTIDPKITKIGDTYKLIKNNIDRWTFNDITKKESILYYNEICKNKDFIVGDCGILYESDDTNAVKLFYSQILFIIYNLKKTGICIFKQIINFKHKILIDMIYIIFNLFEKIDFYKPNQNTFSNEFYIICYNYIGYEKINNFHILFEILDEDNFKENISIIEKYSDDFLYQFSNALNKLIVNFNNAIERQLYYTENWDSITNDHKKEIKKMIHQKNKDWIYLFLQQ